MKKICIGLAVMVMLVFVGGANAAIVLTFDDVSGGATQTSGEQIFNYGGLTWTNTYVVDGFTNIYGSSNYGAAVVSNKNVAFNGYGFSASATDGEFNFIGAHFTAAWQTDLEVELTGYLNGIFVPWASALVGIDPPLLLRTDPPAC